MHQQLRGVPELPCGEGSARAAPIDRELSALLTLSTWADEERVGTGRELACASDAVRHATRVMGATRRARRSEEAVKVTGWPAGRGAREAGKGSESWRRKRSGATQTYASDKARQGFGSARAQAATRGQTWAAARRRGHPATAAAMAASLIIAKKSELQL